MRHLSLSSIALSMALVLVLGLPAMAAASGATPPATAGSADAAAIRSAMMATWDKPEARLEVAPISIEGGHAVAGWIQGDRGGRALLRRDAQGQWLVAACGGDGLKDPKMLAMAGLSASAARSLASKVVQAESAMPAPRRALLSLFDGMVHMDAQGQHPPSAHPAH